jgi:protein involved in polysaccharide export with SLBB domain
MKKITSITLLILAAFVSAAAQETAGARPVRPALNDSTSTAKSAEPLLTEIYRVGVGDVLDIRLLNSPTNRSTLFTVMPGGVIDLPIAGGAIAVTGMTTDEIQARIAAELKRRAVEEKAQVSVGVRQYVSHAVMVTGLVVHPGTRFLRREVVPLFVVLAESQLRNDAGRVLIMRAGTDGETLELSDPQTLNVTVQPGDVITVSHKPQEFYYMLQALLAAGGTTRQENRVEISRAAADGRLATIRYRLKEIKAGMVEDPKLQPGDRVEISR